VIYEFNLPEEADTLDTFQNGPEAKLALDHIRNFIRNRLKYGHEYKNADEAFVAIQDELDIFDLPD